MKILLLTNSADPTSSLLVELCRARGLDVFRWNVDLWDHYETTCSKTTFQITDQNFHAIDLLKEDFVLIWRKPFLAQIDAEIPEVEFVRAQISAWLRTIEFLPHRLGPIFVPPHSDDKVPKLFQLQVAQKYFAVPDYTFSIQENPEIKGHAIVKALKDAMLSDGSLLFTSKVDVNDLERPFPWFVQRGVFSGNDVTCVFIAGKCYWFKCSFIRGQESIDWRKEINTPDQSPWEEIPTKETTDWSEKVSDYMHDLGLNYGRLDFIHDTNEILWFLEVNPNGEFGWLDSEGFPLHNGYLDAALALATR